VNFVAGTELLKGSLQKKAVMLVVIDNQDGKLCCLHDPQMASASNTKINYTFEKGKGADFNRSVQNEPDKRSSGKLFPVRRNIARRFISGLSEKQNGDRDKSSTEHAKRHGVRQPPLILTRKSVC
jgi:hypothetical protein